MMRRRPTRVRMSSQDVRDLTSPGSSSRRPAPLSSSTVVERLTAGDEDEIKPDLYKSLPLPSPLPELAEDYYLILPLQFRFLRKDSPLLQN